MTDPTDHFTPRHPLFKGCTRPAMAMGVPLVPLAVASGAIILITVWTTILVIFTLPVVVIVMRQIAAKDDQQFRLLGLKILFRLIHFNHNRRFWKASAYSPVSFQRRK